MDSVKDSGIYVARTVHCVVHCMNEMGLFNFSHVLLSCQFFVLVELYTVYSFRSLLAQFLCSATCVFIILLIFLASKSRLLTRLCCL